MFGDDLVWKGAKSLQPFGGGRRVNQKKLHSVGGLKRMASQDGVDEVDPFVWSSNELKPILHKESLPKACTTSLAARYENSNYKSPLVLMSGFLLFFPS